MIHFVMFCYTEIIKDWIVRPLRDQHVKPKASATFKCELFKETPNWKWLKGETEVEPSDKIEIKKEGKELTLTIKNCQPDDAAEYAIEVEGRVYMAKLTLGGFLLHTYLLSKASNYRVFKNDFFLYSHGKTICQARPNHPMLEIELLVASSSLVSNIFL